MAYYCRWEILKNFQNAHPIDKYLEKKILRDKKQQQYRPVICRPLYASLQSEKCT